MRSLMTPAAFALLLAAALAFGPAPQDPRSTVSVVLAAYRPGVPSRDAGARVTAAEVFLAALSEEQRGQLVFALDGPERLDWTNVPPGAEESGLRLGDLTRAQVERALDLLACALSEQGYAKARDVLLADDRLLRGGRPRVGFGAENFWLLIFGTPSVDGTWALQLDGHHLAYNLTFVGERVTMSPSFIGAQPSRYLRGEQTVVPMRREVEHAFALVNSLTPAQGEQALLSDRRGAMLAGPGKDGFVPRPEGLSCEELNEDQRAHLVALLEGYVQDLPPAAAAMRMGVLKAELPAMTFAWSGPTQPGSDVSYRVQGPTLLIEYACQDLGGDPLNHLHAIYRDPGNEYGARFSAGD